MAHKSNFVLPFLLLALPLATTAMAQTIDAHTKPDIANHDIANHDLPKQVALARCAYAQRDAACASANTPNRTASAGVEANTLAQLPRRTQGPPTVRAAYPGMWGPQPSLAHVLIGAAIGFGFGAAAGARNGGVRGSLAVGTLVGLIGAAIGAGIPSFPSYNRYRRGWPDYDEEASRSRAVSSRRASTNRPLTHPDPHQPTAHGEDPPLAAETPQEIAISRR